MNAVSLGFLPKPLMLSVECVLPSVKADPRILASYKFRQIRESIAEIGLIEPLVVTAVERKTGVHLVLDGHLRLQAVQELKQTEVPCLVSTDDESFTYNRHINRLSTVQEHVMIRRAIDQGIPAAKLAKGLCIDLGVLVKKSSLLDGICNEVVELLKDRQFSPEVTNALRRMKPTRQVECTELMLAANSVTGSYARALLAATSGEMLVKGGKAMKPTGLTHEQMVRMEYEMSNLLGQYKLAEQTHSEDMLNFMLARGYIVKLLDNPRVMRYLQGSYPEFLEEFSKIVAMTAVEG